MQNVQIIPKVFYLVFETHSQEKYTEKASQVSKSDRLESH